MMSSSKGWSLLRSRSTMYVFIAILFIVSGLWVGKTYSIILGLIWLAGGVISLVRDRKKAPSESDR